MKIWAILPVKPFNRAKSRLAPVLSPEQREALAEKLFRRTLELLTHVKEITGVLVVSRDTKALAIAREYHAYTVQESGHPELNKALLRASQVVKMQGAESVLVFPADIPFATEEDLMSIIKLGRYTSTIVIAPDRREDGTNALMVTPPNLIPFSFGPGSYKRHMELANKANARVKTYLSNQIGLDLDTQDDLDLYARLIDEGTVIDLEILP